MHTELISKIENVSVAIEKTNPPTLVVKATGMAASGSHRNPRLERRIYVTFPTDGIQEYDFMIDIPDGPTTDDIKKHTVEDRWDKFPTHLKGVRVYGKSNYIQANLNFTSNWEAWVNLIPKQPTSGGTLHVIGEIDTQSAKFAYLEEAVPQGTNPKILLLNLRIEDGIIPAINPQQVHYTKSLHQKDQYTGIEILYKGQQEAMINDIKIVQ